jgi:truncated hemoglobin YjbI
MTPYQLLGGEAVLRPLVEDFVRRMVGDAMIGYLFHGVDHPNLVERELELTARFLGADRAYQGRPIKEAHARHRILGGQFDRRTQLLRETLRDYDVPPDVQQVWISHVERLRSQITAEKSGECAD